MRERLATEGGDVDDLLHVQHLLDLPGEVLAHAADVGALDDPAAAPGRVHPRPHLLHKRPALLRQGLWVPLALLSPRQIESRCQQNHHERELCG